jgi:hypothetical protein
MIHLPYLAAAAGDSLIFPHILAAAEDGMGFFAYPTNDMR